VRAVVFDVDGTLLDTNYLHVMAWSRAFRAAGIVVPAVEIHHRIGKSGSLLVEELAGSERDDIEAMWRREYDALKPEIRRLPGARELVLELAKRGAVVGLATSSPQEDVTTMHEVLDVGDALAFTTSADDVDEAKPAPDIFATALEHAGVDASQAIVVGDTVWDVEAATRCGLPCIAVLTGGIGRGDLVDAGATAVYESTAELLTQLNASPLST